MDRVQQMNFGVVDDDVPSFLDPNPYATSILGFVVFLSPFLTLVSGIGRLSSSVKDENRTASDLNKM